jgi:PAS domain S-box-containing protein
MQKIEDSLEQKRLEQALRESEERYRTLAASIPDIICTLDLEGLVTYVNPQWESLLGHKPEEILGKRFTEFIAQEQQPEVISNFEKTRKVKQAFQTMQFKMLHKSGREKWFTMSATPYLNGHGKVMGVVVVIRDITERKYFEDQLRQAQKMEAIGRLAGGVAHDYNNILQSIQSCTQLLLMTKMKDDPDYSKLKQIEKSTLRASQLTKQLLAFSRKAEARLRSLNINEVLINVKELLDRTIPMTIAIHMVLSEELRPVLADANHLEQMIMTLAVNAYEAMPHGGRMIIETRNVTLDENYCSTHMGARSGEYALIAVTDTGAGMAPEMLEHIFEPFYTTKEVGQGTGLGLAMVYGIVKSHGGYITCHSEPITGTTFKIYLPVIVAGAAQMEKDDTEIAPQLPCGQGTILLVDDEESLRQVGQEFLEIEGYTVITAASGEDALEIYREHQNKVDLVILDLIMPGMGGRACLKTILQINPKQKVIIVSGFSADAQVREVVEEGALGFLSKPYDLGGMIKIINNALSMSPAWGRACQMPR